MGPATATSESRSVGSGDATAGAPYFRPARPRDRRVWSAAGLRLDPAHPARWGSLGCDGSVRAGRGQGIRQGPQILGNQRDGLGTTNHQARTLWMGTILGRSVTD